MKSKASLKHLNGDINALSQLKEVARYPVEKKALHVLLKFDLLQITPTHSLPESDITDFDFLPSKMVADARTAKLSGSVISPEKLSRDVSKGINRFQKNLKGPLFTRFKNQYNQTEAEEAIANTLSSYLERPIREQVGKTLGAKMVGVMKSSEHHFSSKMALKVKILTDLHENDSFEDYMAYISNVKDYLKKRIKYYTVQFCNEKLSGENTRLQISAKEEVSRLIGVVESKVIEVNETDIHEWLSAFCSDKTIIDELGIALNVDELLNASSDAPSKLNLDNFKRQIHSGLEGLKKKLHTSLNSIKCENEMVHWKDKPHKLLEKLIGCTKQCPFCKEQCDWLDPNHVDAGQKHKIAVHRPSFLGGYCWNKTSALMTDFCPALVASDRTFQNKPNQKPHPYKDYQSIYPDWSIPPDHTSEESLYWKLFVGKYSKELERVFDTMPPQVPEQWLTIKWQDVENFLNKIYLL